MLQKSLSAGEVLFKQGDEAHDWYVVLNGRMRAIETKPDGKKKVSCGFAVCDCVDVL